MRRDGSAHNLSSIEVCTVTGLVGVAVPELRACGANLHPDEGVLEPRLVTGQGQERRREQED
jgi:hypothetical protein